MKYTKTILSILICLSAVPLVAQTTIGGGTCSASNLNGNYEVLLSGRQSVANQATNLLQGVGTATFDGSSNVTLALTLNTVTPAQTFGTAVTYTGTYSVQANCSAAITITGGDSATFSVEIQSQGRAFVLIGSDAMWVYNGNGNLQSFTSACQTGMLSGAYAFLGGGSALSSTGPGAGVSTVGLLQFDGQGNVTGNWTQVASTTNGTTSSSVSITGNYSITSACSGSITLTDTANNKYTAPV